MPFPNIGAPELIIILIIALIVLGPGKLPDVAQSLGRSVREFRKAATDVTDATKLEPTAGSQGTNPGAPQPNSLSGSVPPNTLGGSATSPTSGDGSATPPAA
jgi:TatA/E family protein of Tat protein translocase